MEEHKQSEEDNASCLLRDVLDSIHCHLIHSFDIGLRLTLTEKHLIATDDELEFESQTPSKTLSKSPLNSLVSNPTKHRMPSPVPPPNRAKSLNDLTPSSWMVSTDGDVIGLHQTDGNAPRTVTKCTPSARWMRTEFAFIALRSVLKEKQRAFQRIQSVQKAQIQRTHRIERYQMAQIEDNKFMTKMGRCKLDRFGNGFGDRFGNNLNVDSNSNLKLKPNLKSNSKRKGTEKETKGRVSMTLFYGFSYWTEDQKKEEWDPRNPGLRRCDVYVAPKWIHLKEEMLHHGSCSYMTCDMMQLCKCYHVF